MSSKTIAANLNEKPVAEALADERPEARRTEAPSPAAIVATAETPAVQPKRKRRFGRVLLMLLVPAALAAGGAYVWATGGRYQETDNANLRQARLTVASDVSGRVVETHVSDNGAVGAGDVLFVVDPQPYRIALSQADAALAAARLQVEQLRAAHDQARTGVSMAKEEVAYFQAELDRQSELTRKGVGTGAALDSSRRDLTRAREQEASAAQAVQGALAALGGDASIATDSHPTVLNALAARDRADFMLAQTTVRAPADGVAYQAASFQAGQYVAAGTPLFALVETGESWIDANFKETQLEHMALGQEAEIRIDAFPDQPLKATVEAIGAGTGAEFSLLPAQNATGNWVKVTQRIPVRLKVEADPAAAMPRTGPLLRTGMSATVEVDTGHARGFGALVPKALAGLMPAAMAASDQR